MSSRRTLILVAAIAIGAIAAFMLWGYIGGIQDTAYDNAQKVEVYVVKQEIPKGTYGEEAASQKLIVKDEIPKKFYPPNAIKDLSVDLGGKVAVNNLAVNQIVTTDMFADPTSVQQTFANRIDQINGVDQVAVSISVDQTRGVVGLLQPGDYVNLLATDSNSGVGKEKTATGDDASGAATATETDKKLSFSARTIFQKVRILAIDQTPVAQPGEAQSTSGDDPAATTVQNRGLITFVVPAKAAQYIASLDPSQIYLVLVSPDYKPTPIEPTDPNAPVPGEDPTQLTPYGPDGAGSE